MRKIHESFPSYRQRSGRFREIHSLGGPRRPRLYVCRQSPYKFDSSMCEIGRCLTNLAGSSQVHTQVILHLNLLLKLHRRGPVDCLVLFRHKVRAVARRVSWSMSSLFWGVIRRCRPDLMEVTRALNGGITRPVLVVASKTRPFQHLGARE